MGADNESVIRLFRKKFSSKLEAKNFHSWPEVVDTQDLVTHNFVQNGQKFFLILFLYSAH